MIHGRRRSLSDSVQSAMTPDMTPMIDCVFLLMIFFVLVIDLNQKELEDLILPRATQIEIDDEPAKDRPVVNVLQDGRVKCLGTVYYDPMQTGTSAAAMAQLARDLKARVKPEAVRTQMVDGRPNTIIDEPILIRADKWTRWAHVDQVIHGAAQRDATFWKLELALSEVDREQPTERR